MRDVYTKLVEKHGLRTAKFGEVQSASSSTTPQGAPKIEPASANIRLAGHFQNVVAVSQAVAEGRPLQSLFQNATPSAPATPVAKPPGVPLSIIPASVQAAVQSNLDGVKLGAIPLQRSEGPLNIVSRAPGGLLQKHAPLYGLFKTDGDKA